MPPSPRGGRLSEAREGDAEMAPQATDQNAWIQRSGTSAWLLGHAAASNPAFGAVRRT